MSGGEQGPLAIAAAIIERAGRVLVQTRPPGSSWAGHWEFPGGKLEAGESAADCAVRECREELGLAVRVRGPLHVTTWSYPRRTVRVEFLLCEALDADAQPEPRDGQQLRWADLQDLRRLPFLPANADVLALLAARLAGA